MEHMFKHKYNYYIGNMIIEKKKLEIYFEKNFHYFN